jgi:bile acid:Na+ symporter, BASS family
MRTRDIILLVLSLGGLAAGVLWPGFGLLVTPWTAQILMVQVFLGFLGVDFGTLARLRPADVLEVGVISTVKLFVLPGLLWAICAWLAPDLALPVLLLSGVSTGVTASFIAIILDANPNRMLQVTVVTSVLVPITLPGLVSLLMGQHLEIPFSHMARLLAVILLPPGILVFLLRQYAPRLVMQMERLAVPLGLALFFFVTLAVIAPFAGQVTGNVGRVAVSLGLATLLAVVFVAFGLGMSYLWPRRFDGLSAALGLTCINSVLVAVFAARFFGPDPTLLAVMYMFPYLLILLPMRWMAKRLKGQEKSCEPQGLHSPVDSNLLDCSSRDTYLFHDSSPPSLRINNQ